MFCSKGLVANFFCTGAVVAVVAGGAVAVDVVAGTGFAGAGFAGAAVGYCYDDAD